MDSQFGNFKLGRRLPSDGPQIRFAEIWRGTVPEHPVMADHFSKVTDWGLWGNNRFGVCGPVSAGNQIKQESAYLAGTELSVTQNDIFDLYRRSGNPNFDPVTGEGDNGVDMQTMCKALLDGGLGGTRALGFASVNVAKPEELKAAIAIFGSLLDGVLLYNAQQAQTDKQLWDYVSGSGVWGGHAILGGRYDPKLSGVITWGEIVDMTESFVSHQLEEAWLVIYKWHLGTTQFIEHIDQAALAGYFHDLTGRDFPIAPPTPPPPSPVPGDGCGKWIARINRAKLALDGKL